MGRGTANDVWSRLPGEWGTAEPECEKQMIEYPLGSGEPLYSIFEEFAANQQNFVHDFVIAMEKMTANGYPEGLTDAPDHWTGVTCIEPLKISTAVTCFKAEAAGSGYPMFIQSNSDDTPGWALQHDQDTGKLMVAPVENKANPTPWQRWVLSESGNQLINQGTGIPMAVDGYSSFKITKVEFCWGSYTQIRSTYNPTIALTTYFAPVNKWNNPPYRVATWWIGNGKNQQWTITTDCVPAAVPYGNTFQVINVMKRKMLTENGQNGVSMTQSSGTTWQWAYNSCDKEQKYLISSSSGKILAADGKTLSDQLEGNSWSYDEVEKTLENESCRYLQDRKKKGQTVAGIRRKDGKPWKWFQWTLV